MSETKEQIEIVKWFRATFPAHAMSVLPSMNGASRRGRAGAILWRTMQALGASVGNLDFFIAVPKGGKSGLFIEHKAAGGAHQVTDEQNRHIEYYRGLGYEAVSTRGIEAAKAAIIAYMAE